MRITFSGFGPRIVEVLDLAANFFAERLMHARTLDKMKIHVNHASVFKEDIWTVLAECEVFDDITVTNPKRFGISLYGKMTMLERLDNLAHEMVHVEQWASGRRKDYVHHANKVRFDGKVYNTDRISYIDTPWEVEANGRTVALLHHLWIQYPGLAKKYKKS